MKSQHQMPQKVFILSPQIGLSSYVVEILQGLGSRHVICASSIEEANKINQELNFDWTCWDSVIINLDLPTLDSDFLNHIKNKNNFFFITTQSHEKNGLLAARYSLKQLIFKPFSTEDLRYHLSEISKS
jgi:response regulator RpfG family c-di-GMP phosphodiesterase